MMIIIHLLSTVIFACTKVVVVARIIDQISDFQHAQTINEMAIGILKNCYSNSETLVIHGGIDENTCQLLSSLGIFSQMIHNNSSMTSNTVEFQRKMDLFIVTVHTNEQFEETLLTFKYSPWWNIMAPYFILDRSNNSCGNAMDIFIAAWKMNIVTSFFLCIDTHQVLMIYTYNPYTNRAPKSWNEVSSTIDKLDGFTIYARQYHTENICNDLKFDRTRYLDGSKVRIVTMCHSECTWTPGKKYNENVISELYPHDALIIKTLKMSLNATLILSFDDNDDGNGNEPQGYLKHVQTGSSDLAVSWRSPSATYNLTKTYPISYSAISIATNNRGYCSPLDKIKKFYGTITLISMSIILTMTFIVVIISAEKIRCSFAIFEILRLLVNASLQSRMNTLSCKIFFSMIFLYFLIFHATFQGHLAAFLTRIEYRKSAETLQDLKDSKYSAIYTYPGVSDIIEDPVLKKKMIMGHIACGWHLVNNDAAACVTDIIFLVELTMKHNFHLSKKPIGNSKYVYTTRNDWPLKHRVDMILIRLEQSGLADKWVQMFTEKYKKQTAIWELSSKDFREVTLSSLMFAFDILGVGLMLATICFLLEKFIGRKYYINSKIRNEEKIVQIQR